MNVINLEKNLKRTEFAKRASECFKKQPSYYVYTEKEPNPGELFAVRWSDCTVLVFQIDEHSQCELYGTHELIGDEIGELKPKKIK